jgi:hypothetical protein
MWGYLNSALFFNIQVSFDENLNIQFFEDSPLFLRDLSQLPISANFNRSQLPVPEECLQRSFYQEAQD